MTLSAARDTKARDVVWTHELLIKMKGSTTIYKGSMVALDGGYAIPGAVTAGLLGMGRALETKTNSGSSGDVSIRVQVGIFSWALKSGDEPAAANIGNKVFMHDDATVKATQGTAGVAGILVDVDSTQAWVAMGYLIAPSDSLTSLASTADGAGASLVGIEDDGSFTSQGNVEEALQEIYQHILTSQKSVSLNLNSWRECANTGAVGNAAANGGILASDTTPVLGAEATTEAQSILWAAGNSDIIVTSFSLPTDFDGTANATLDLFVRTNNTGADAATFTVLSTWDNGSQVTDTATDSSPSTTLHKITATIAAADIADTASHVSIQLVLGTHATDGVILMGARLNYKAKLLTS